MIRLRSFETKEQILGNDRVMPGTYINGIQKRLAARARRVSEAIQALLQELVEEHDVV